MLGKELLGPVHKCTQKYETEPLLCSSSQKILLGKVLVLYSTVHESRGTGKCAVFLRLFADCREEASPVGWTRGARTRF